MRTSHIPIPRQAQPRTCARSNWQSRASAWFLLWVLLVVVAPISSEPADDDWYDTSFLIKALSNCVSPSDSTDQKPQSEPGSRAPLLQYLLGEITESEAEGLYETDLFWTRRMEWDPRVSGGRLPWRLAPRRSFDSPRTPQVTLKDALSRTFSIQLDARQVETALTTCIELAPAEVDSFALSTGTSNDIVAVWAITSGEPSSWCGIRFDPAFQTDAYTFFVVHMVQADLSSVLMLIRLARTSAGLSDAEGDLASGQSAASPNDVACPAEKNPDVRVWILSGG